MSSKITIDYKKDETELLYKLTMVNSVANENSGSLEGIRDGIMQNTKGGFTYALQDVPGKGKGLVVTKKILKGTRIVSKEAVITIKNRLPASGYKHPYASKSKTLANTSGKHSSLCIISTCIRMMLRSISGLFKQTPYLLNLSGIKVQFSWKHAALTSLAKIMHKRIGTRRLNNTLCML
jgi:hypothetical protein